MSIALKERDQKNLDFREVIGSWMPQTIFHKGESE